MVLSLRLELFFFVVVVVVDERSERQQKRERRRDETGQKAPMRRRRDRRLAADYAADHAADHFVVPVEMANVQRRKGELSHVLSDDVVRRLVAARLPAAGVGVVHDDGGSDDRRRRIVPAERGSPLDAEDLPMPIDQVQRKSGSRGGIAPEAVGLARRSSQTSS